MAPVSPRQRSTWSIPSTHVKCAPWARSTNVGHGPGHLTIHDIGTPPGIDAFARSCSSRERGRCASKVRTASACRAATREGSTPPVDPGAGRTRGCHARPPIAPTSTSRPSRSRSSVMTSGGRSRMTLPYVPHVRTTDAGRVAGAWRRARPRRRRARWYRGGRTRSRPWRRGRGPRRCCRARPAPAPARAGPRTRPSGRARPGPPRRPRPSRPARPRRRRGCRRRSRRARPGARRPSVRRGRRQRPAACRPPGPWRR